MLSWIWQNAIIFSFVKYKKNKIFLYHALFQGGKKCFSNVKYSCTFQYYMDPRVEWYRYRIVLQFLKTGTMRSVSILWVQFPTNIIFDLRGPSCHWQKYYIWPQGALSLTEILYLTSGGPPVIDRVLIAETLGPVIDRVLIAESLGPVIDRVLIVDTWGGCHLQSTHRRDLGHHGGGALSYLITVYSTL